VLPRDFDAIDIPFPERGEPELISWDERRAGDIEDTHAVADPAR